VLKDNGVFIAPTFCVGEDVKSKIIITIAGLFSGFKVINKWSINGYSTMLTNNGFKIKKIERVNGRFPLAYVVLTK